jgi:hypothetical protein
MAVRDRFPFLDVGEKRLPHAKDRQAQAAWDAKENAIRIRLPLALVMATQVPRIPVLLRPLLSLWWLAYFTAGGLGGWAVFAWARKVLVGAPVLRVLLPVVLDFGILFAVNLYLMLAAAALIRQPMLWQRLWRWRLAVDLALTLATQWFILKGF